MSLKSLYQQNTIIKLIRGQNYMSLKSLYQQNTIIKLSKRLSRGLKTLNWNNFKTTSESKNTKITIDTFLNQIVLWS